MKSIQMLWELQNLLKEEDKLLKELKNLSQVTRLKSLKEEIEKSQKALQQQKEIYQKKTRPIKHLEDEIEAIKVKQKEISSLLYSGEITNVKELESTNSKLDTLNQEISQLENQLIELMEEKENLYNGLQEENSANNVKKDEYRNLRGQYQQAKEALQQQMDNFPAKKDDLLAQIDSLYLDIYNDLRKRFNFSAVAKVDNNICSGCHMRISFDLQKKLRNADEVLYCDICGRMIFAK